MSWRLVDGVPLPDAVGGHPALDFCNTRAGWGAGRPKEYLRSPDVLALWARENGLVAVPSRPRDGTRGVASREQGSALARALALREALYRCALRHGTDPDWDLVSLEAARARAASVLVPAGDGVATWRPRAAPGTVADALRAIALAADALLTCELVTFVAACPGAGCGWLFADRRRRRRWCSMAACGNRAKARRYAERHGAGV
ncbi:MAG TPA: ABATE domain-containing protein [Kineosporiaceae bacterium]|nr:ABATE domain-containing protein [Kineosporiaceae bacterium]